ncbi:hypothetical protein Tco_0997900 [Tanacetum coccineum]
MVVNHTITPNVDLTYEALEVLDFDSFDSNVGDDTASIRKRNLRKLRKTDGQSSGIVNTLFKGQACSFMLCDLYFWPSSLSLSSMPSCDLVSLTNMLILFIILKALFQSLRKSLSLNLELSR